MTLGEIPESCGKKRPKGDGILQKKPSAEPEYPSELPRNIPEDSMWRVNPGELGIGTRLHRPMPTRGSEKQTRPREAQGQIAPSFALNPQLPPSPPQTYFPSLRHRPRRRSLWTSRFGPLAVDLSLAVDLPLDLCGRWRVAGTHAVSEGMSSSRASATYDVPSGKLRSHTLFYPPFHSHSSLSPTFLGSGCFFLVGFLARCLWDLGASCRRAFARWDLGATFRGITETDRPAS